MASSDQKQRYREQAGIFYMAAAGLTGEQAASMLRLGDAYAALAVEPDRLLPNIFAPSKYTDPLCQNCGRKLQLMQSLPLTDTVPTMHKFRCEACGEVLVWRSDSRSPDKTSSNPNREHYVAASFRRTAEGFAPGPAVECPDPALAIQRAELLLRERNVVGAVAFSRAVDPTTGVFEAAVILRNFGELPEGFDIA